MALQKTIELESGVSGDYLVLQGFHFLYDKNNNNTDPFILVRYALYKDAEAFQSGKAPLENRTEMVKCSDIQASDIDFSDLERMGYLLLKRNMPDAVEV